MCKKFVNIFGKYAKTMDTVGVSFNWECKLWGKCAKQKIAPTPKPKLVTNLLICQTIGNKKLGKVTELLKMVKNY